MNQPSVSLPKISIVIPAFNASSQIEECLEHIYASKFKEFETIVVDDASTDSTLPKAAHYPCQVLKNKTNRGAAASRNLGMEIAKAGIILLVDSDVLIPPDLLNQVFIFFMDHPNVSILQGCYNHKPYYQNLLSQYKHFVFSFRGTLSCETEINYVHTACVAMRRTVIQKFRFNENLKRREDIEFGLRCSESGYRIYADPSLNVGHKKRYDFFSYSKYQFETAKNLILQHLVMKNKNFTQEFNSGKQPFYKKAWLLRPAVCFLLMLDLIFLSLTKSFFSFIILTGLLTLSFLLEYQFRLYLFRVAPPFVSLGACLIYFYDGFLVGLGAAAGILEAISHRYIDGKSKKNNKELPI